MPPLSVAAVDLCNIALLRVGENLLTAFDDASPAAKACALLYPQIRDALLEEYPWRMVVKRVRLAALADPPIPAEGPFVEYTRQFQLPSDYATIVETDVLGEHYRIERSPASGLVLLASQDTVHIVYAQQGEQAAVLLPMWREALCFRLASDLAIGLTGKEALMKAHQTRGDQLELRAALRNGREDGLHQPFLSARYSRVRHTSGGDDTWAKSRVGGIGW